MLELLTRDGVTLALDGADGLRIHAPKGMLTPSLRDRLVAQKPALVEWLRKARGDTALALPRCVPEPEALHEPFALSDLQLGFYMANDPFMEFHVRPHYYNEKDLGALDVARYEAAWNRALRRHAKELVVVRPDGLLQTLRDPAPLRVQVNDWRELPPREAQDALAALRARMERSELPIDRWPWMDVEVSLWREAGPGAPRDRVRLHFNLNNFFSDGFGSTQLLAEVDRLYADPALRLPPLQLAFRDAALALDRIAESEAGQTARRYWEDRLEALPAALPLPLRPGMEKRCRSRLKRREGFLEAAQWQALKRHGQGLGLTSSAVVFAVYAEIASIWSNCRHFLLSNMMTRRLDIHPELRSIVGNFASLYPLEVDLRDRRDFAAGARRIQERVMQDARHVYWGGMRVMQALSRLRGAMGQATVPFVVGSGLFMEGFERFDYSCLETSQVMLDHQFWELPDGRLYFVWDVLDEFFPEGLIDDMWLGYGQLLSHLAADPRHWEAASFDMLPQWQREQRHQAAPDAVTLPDGLLGDLLHAAAKARPGSPAVSCGDTTLSHADLSSGAHAVAAALRQAGAGVGDRVAIVADKGAQWLQAVHGVLQVGAAYVPIDPSLPVDRCAVMLADSGARITLATQRCADRAWPPGVTPIVIDTLAPGASQPAPAGLNGDSLAYLIYTSGSTGQPKGVMISHRAALNTLHDINRRFGIGPADRVFGVSAIGFDLSVYDVLGAAAAGACVVYPSPDQALNPSHWLDQMADRQVTVWNSAPQLAVLLVEAAQARGITLPALRVVMLSGDWIPLGLPDRLRAIAPDARIVSLGGATEASIWSIVFEIGTVDPSWPSIPYGRPMDNQTWYVLDEYGNDVPVWAAGELYIGGAGLALGYWNDPQKTQLAFAPHPRSGERLYRTGDIGRYLPGGLIEFLGRRDSQVKIQGHRVELGEVEAALRAHTAVADAVVVVQRPPGGAMQLAAYVVARPQAEVDDQALRRFLGERLPRYMVPSLFATVPALPLSRNGKLDRAALAPILPAEQQVAEQAPCMPRDTTEARLHELWAQVLGHDRFGVGDDFFAVGGQSFEGVRLAGLIKDAFGTRLSLGDVWQHRSIAEQAQLTRTGMSGGAALHVLSSRDGEATPLFLVHPAGGQVVCYRHLAALLKRSVYGFEARLGDGGIAPGASVPEMAAHYLSQLQSRHPQGPVLLGGWSSGGPIAFEMAAQLLAAGRAVEGVVIIDSPAPAQLPAVERTEVLAWFAEDLSLEPATLALDSATAADPDHPAELRALAQSLGAAGRQLPATVDQLLPVYRVFDTVVRANRRYRAPVIDVDLLVLRAREGSVSEFALHPHHTDPAWGWPLHTSRHAAWKHAAGTHHTLLTPSRAGACADAIEAWIAGYR